jgi:hypothetical protein
MRAGEYLARRQRAAAVRFSSRQQTIVEPGVTPIIAAVARIPSPGVGRISVAGAVEARPGGTQRGKPEWRLRHRGIRWRSWRWCRWSLVPGATLSAQPFPSLAGFRKSISNPQELRNAFGAGCRRIQRRGDRPEFEYLLNVFRWLIAERQFAVRATADIHSLRPQDTGY